jgi:putative membrane protein
MPEAWIAYAVVLWGWHLPWVYESALGDRFLHDLEHLALFGSAILFWWPVVGPAPHFGRPGDPALRVAYLVMLAVILLLYRFFASETAR